MPNGPGGEKRPADAVGRAVQVAKIATREIDESPTEPRQPAKAVGGYVGGKARATRLSSGRRSEIARKAAATRWDRRDSKK